MAFAARVSNSLNPVVGSIRIATLASPAVSGPLAVARPPAYAGPAGGAGPYTVIVGSATLFTVTMISTADALRATYREGRIRPLAWRRRQLLGRSALLEANEAELLEAPRTDLGKPALEGFITDIAFVAGEIKL